MSRAKVFISILTVLILIALSGVSVWAAPGGQEPAPEPIEEPTTISGVIEDIVIEETGDTVMVTLVDETTGETQTVCLSLETAITLELVEEDAEGNPIANTEKIGQHVEIDPNDVIEPEQPPEEEPTFISGVIEDIVIEETGDTVLVTLVDETTGETQTVCLSLETAITLGLVEEDAEGNPIANTEKIGQHVEIDPNDVIEDGEEEGEEVLHPVVLALTKFFAKLFADTLELDYDETMDEIMGYHEDGMGFGVIAQACWMSFILNDPDDSDAPKITPRDILEAKKNHTLGSIDPELLGVEETPTNWGQFKKAVLKSGKVQKNLANLGAIMSGRAAGEQEQEEEEDDVVVGSSTELSGKGKDKGGKPDAPPGKVKNKDKDKGGGPPAVPPGQEKDKDKDKGGGKGKGK